MGLEEDTGWLTIRARGTTVGNVLGLGDALDVLGPLIDGGKLLVVPLVRGVSGGPVGAAATTGVIATATGAVVALT